MVETTAWFIRFWSYTIFAIYQGADLRIGLLECSHSDFLYPVFTLDLSPKVVLYNWKINCTIIGFTEGFTESTIKFCFSVKILQRQLETAMQHERYREFFFWSIVV